MDKETLERAFDLAQNASKLSDCVMRHVGATLVRDKEILSTGNNRSLIHGRCCDLFSRHDKENHKIWSSIHEVHAEIDCINNCAKSGISTDNTEMVITYSPCTACAQAIITAGIKKVYMVPELQEDKIIKKNIGVYLLLTNNIEVEFLDQDCNTLKAKTQILIHTILTEVDNMLLQIIPQ